MRRLLFTILVVWLLPGAAHASWRAPCAPGGGPTCTWWNARTVFVADGDTIDARIHGRVQHVRFTGINAPELTRYSHIAAHRRGPCHGVAAADFVDRYAGGRHIRLAAQDPASRSGRRIRRSVWVRVDGRWRDLARMEMRAGLALWMPNDAEWAHDRDYSVLAERALAAHRGIYSTTACGAGPQQAVPISLAVHWDANGNDSRNIGGEYVDIRNDGREPLRLGGWFFRDSALRKTGRVYGYPFPRGTTIASGRSLRLSAGCGTDSATFLHWCTGETVFENVNRRKGSGDGGYLFDGDGDLRAADIYPCRVTCHRVARVGQISLAVHPTTPESITLYNAGPQISLADTTLKLRDHGIAGQYVFGLDFPLESVLGPRSFFTWRLSELAPRLSDNGGVVELRTLDNRLLACQAWGFGRC